MRTLGIDLAASPTKTATCAIDWHSGSAEVSHLEPGADDDALVELAEPARVVAIDCPLGWPDPFVNAVTAHHRGDRWPGTGEDDPIRYRRSLTLRATDEHIVTTLGLTPLSVSANFLGITAMRCALVCDRLAAAGTDIRRDGTGAIAEVYPAAALKQWGLLLGPYKTTKGAPAIRRQIVESLFASMPWLVISPTDRARCEASHDLLDAVVCALVARAVALDLTVHAPPEEEELALREGWIHVPAAGSLADLASV